MKTAGKITATLALLLGLYVLSYWLLIKKDWAYALFFDSTALFRSQKVYFAICDSFEPIQELEEIWTVDIPTQKHLTGHWRSETNNDFVTLGPNQECHFQLGQFAFKGTAKYERDPSGFTMEFPHQEHLYIFWLSRSLVENLSNPATQSAVSIEQAEAFIDKDNTNPLLPVIREYETQLTKQTPSAPAP
jgi:hypothetical protein